jgi:replicative DNA helicase
MRLGGLREEDWDRLHEAARDLSSSPLFVDDTASLSLMTLRAKARRLKARHGLKLAIVDYLQLMDAPEAESRQQEISRITRGLKVVARELSIPIIVLSQLNRAVENREDRRPRLADLRESGAIEQDADLILLLFREDYYREKVDEERKGVTEVIVAKQRNGPTGKVDLQFLAESMRFESAAFQRS